MEVFQCVKTNLPGPLGDVDGKRLKVKLELLVFKLKLILDEEKICRLENYSLKKSSRKASKSLKT